MTHTLSLKQFVIWTDAVSLHQQRACWLINTVFCYCRINCPGHRWAAGDKSQHSHWEQHWRPLFLSLSFCSTTTSQPFVNDCFSAYLFFTVRVLTLHPVIISWPQWLGAQRSHLSPMVLGGQMHCPVLASQLFPTWLQSQAAEKERVRGREEGFIHCSHDKIIELLMTIFW